jgi:hypothetical protein
MLHFRLTRTGLDLTVHERDGRYMATADLAEDSRDVGVGDTPHEAGSTSGAVCETMRPVHASRPGAPVLAVRVSFRSELTQPADQSP